MNEVGAGRRAGGRAGRPAGRSGVLLGILAALFAGCTRPAANPDAIRVGLVTPGSIADASWNSGAYAGLMQIRDSLGMEVSHVEARTPGEQEEQLRTYAAQGYTIIFGHGFEFQDAAERVAQDYPGPIFVITSGQRLAGNVVPPFSRIPTPRSKSAVLSSGTAASACNRLSVVAADSRSPPRTNMCSAESSPTICEIRSLNSARSVTRSTIGA